MDVSQLKRDPKKIRTLYTEMEDGSVICNKPFEVYLPRRFIEKGLADVSDTVRTIAVLGIVIPGECYAPLIGLMEVSLAPSGIREVTVDGNKYLVLEFDKGDTFIENTQVPKDSNVSYTYYLEFLVYAKIPWYMGQNDLSSIFDNAKQETGKGVGSTPQVIRVLISLMYRDPDNYDNPYRNSKAMLDGRPPHIVGLNNASMLVDGTFPRLMGGYLNDNILSAIINPDDKVTDLEQIMKGVPE